MIGNRIRPSKRTQRQRGEYGETEWVCMQWFPPRDRKFLIGMEYNKHGECFIIVNRRKERICLSLSQLDNLIEALTYVKVALRRRPGKTSCFKERF